MRDLIIAGGGPVGLATALYAAQAGLAVQVREPRMGPIDKACGEGLMPAAVADLAALGVAPDGHHLAGIRYLGSGQTVEASFRDGHGLGVRRTRLHADLGAAVERAGIEVVRRAVETVRAAPDRVIVDGTPARFLVGADGLHSRVRRLIGAEQRRDGPRRYGLRAHASIAPWSAFVEVHWAPTSEAYLTPVAPDLVGVAVLTDQPRTFPELLKEHPLLMERFAGAGWGAVRGAGPLRQQVDAVVRGRVLLVGDASGYLDAITGEGIALGLVQARAAVAALLANRPGDYAAAHRRIGQRHELLTRALLRGSRVPALRRRIVPMAARMPRVFANVVDQLARPA